MELKDLDLGHYERFLNVTTSLIMLLQEEFIFSYWKGKKRRIFGKTVQVVPHITNEIKDRMQLLGNSGDFDIVITEIEEQLGILNLYPI
jgi:CTP synthase